MNRELYFIPLLARAFDVRDRPRALLQALSEIGRLGQLEEYRIGFRQFQRFMVEAYCPQVPTVRLEKGERVLAEVIPCQATQELRISDIRPGDYAIRLSTGRLLWSGNLQEGDLIWARAFPTAALPLAADTGDSRAVWTQEMKCLRNEIVMRVYPGIEHGMIGLWIDRWKIT